MAVSGLKASRPGSRARHRREAVTAIYLGAASPRWGRVVAASIDGGSAVVEAVQTLAFFALIGIALWCVVRLAPADPGSRDE